MKKIIFVLLFVSGITFQSVAVSPAMLTFDIKNWLTSIDQMYAIYDQISTNIEQLKVQYEQYQQAIEAVRGFKMDEIKWDGDLDFRNEIASTVGSVNRQLTNIRNLKNVFTRPSMHVNGQSFSIADLVGAGRQGQTADVFFQAHHDAAEKRLKLVKRAFTTGLTDAEYMAIGSKYGYDPGNYLMIRNAEAQLKSQLGKAIAASSEIGSEEWANAQAMMYGPLFKKAMGENASPKEVQQAVLMHQKVINESINLLGTNLNQVGSLIAWNIEQQKLKERAKKQRAELIQKSKKSQVGVSAMFIGGNSLKRSRKY